jgi:predicted N-acetyltransferase YhbS
VHPGLQSQPRCPDSSRGASLPANMRRQGLGTEVMRAVEKEAKSRSCRQIVLETHEFQAPKLGFEVVSRVANYPRGHNYMTHVKSLA